MLEYLFVAFAVISGIQAFFYLSFLIFFPKKSRNTHTSNSKPVSVIVCAKNEAENLQQHLPYLEEQDYPQYELVLINDNSTDNTLEILKQFQASASIPVKIVNVAPTERFWGNKKFALTLGIKAARFEQLLFTDADCIPVSNRWISSMVSQINPTRNIILGYGAYQKVPNSLLNKLIRFETLLTALLYFSFAKMGMPYMGVGRNLLYTKKTFFDARGFMNHMHIRSGDDDLFINQVATAKNTQCETSSESFTMSIPKRSFKAWIHQKRRHISTAFAYRISHRITLGLFHLTQVLFFILALILVISGFQLHFVLGIIGLRYAGFFLSLIPSSMRLKETDLLLFAPLFELFLLFVQIYIFIRNLISKPAHW